MPVRSEDRPVPAAVVAARVPLNTVQSLVFVNLFTSVRIAAKSGMPLLSSCQDSGQALQQVVQSPLQFRDPLGQSVLSSRDGVFRPFVRLL